MCFLKVLSPWQELAEAVAVNQKAEKRAYRHPLEDILINRMAILQTVLHVFLFKIYFVFSKLACSYLLIKSSGDDQSLDLRIQDGRLMNHVLLPILCNIFSSQSTFWKTEKHKFIHDLLEQLSANDAEMQGNEA